MKSEKPTPQTKQDNDSIISVIASKLNQYASSRDVDVKNILMLIAALGLINIKDNNLASSAARKLASGGRK